MVHYKSNLYFSLVSGKLLDTLLQLLHHYNLKDFNHEESKYCKYRKYISKLFLRCKLCISLKKKKNYLASPRFELSASGYRVDELTAYRKGHRVYFSVIVIEVFRGKYLVNCGITVLSNNYLPLTQFIRVLVLLRPRAHSLRPKIMWGLLS